MTYERVWPGSCWLGALLPLQRSALVSEDPLGEGIRRLVHAEQRQPYQMALNLGLPIGCLAAAPGTDGDQLLAAGLSQFVGRYWTGEIVLLSVSAGSTAPVTLGKSSLRAGVAGLGWLPVQAGTGMSKQRLLCVC